MAKEEDGKPLKLSEVMAVLEEAYPDAGPEKLMKAAACLMAEDDDDGGDDGDDMHADDGDPYEDETEEQMTERQAEEMAKCASDGEREAMAKKHMAEKQRFAERRDRNRGLEVKSDMADQKGDKSLQSAIAKHPMVVKMASELNDMRAAQAKASAKLKVEQAIREGRLIPAQKDWAIAYCSADPSGFETFIGSQPKILQSGADGTFVARIGEAKEQMLSQKELSICQNLGLASHFGGIDTAIEKFAAAKKQRLSTNVHLD